MLPTYVIYITLFTSLIGIFSYIRSIVKGNTRPNLASWFMWFLAPMVASLVGFVSGAGVAILPVFLAGFGPLLVLVFSLFYKNSFWKLSKIDYLCLALSLSALACWFIWHEGVLAVIFAILADGIAYVPTYIKSWKNPETENPWPYGIGIFNYILGLLVLPELTFLTAGFGFYLIVGNSIEISIISFRRRNKKI